MEDSRTQAFWQEQLEGGRRYQLAFDDLLKIISAAIAPLQWTETSAQFLENKAELRCGKARLIVSMDLGGARVDLYHPSLETDEQEEWEDPWGGVVARRPAINTGERNLWEMKPIDLVGRHAKGQLGSMIQWKRLIRRNLRCLLRKSESVATDINNLLSEWRPRRDQVRRPLETRAHL